MIYDDIFNQNTSIMQGQSHFFIGIVKGYGKDEKEGNMEVILYLRLMIMLLLYF